MTMYALTLRPPWSYAVTHLGKNCENRPYPPPVQEMGEDWLVIHAGKRWSPAAVTFMEGLGLSVPPPEEVVHSACVAVCRVVGFYSMRADNQMSMDRWAMPGGYPWQLDDIRPLVRPVAIPGQQGLWVPGDLLKERILHQIPAGPCAPS